MHRIPDELIKSKGAKGVAPFPAAVISWDQNSCGCGASADREVFCTTRDHNFGTITGECEILRCENCGSLYSEKFPNAESLYTVYKSYYTAPKARGFFRSMVRRLMDTTRREYMLRAVPRLAQSVLDFGCGSGEFLGYLRARGYTASLFGTDLSKPVGELTSGFNWVQLECLSDRDNCYDWVTLNHVIEHIQFPETAIATVSKILRGKGSVWISTPNAASFLIRIFKGYSRDLDFPRHRQVFSRAALVALLASSGYTVAVLNPPRINSVLNCRSCIRNLWRCKDANYSEKIGLLFHGLAGLIVHLVRPAALRIQESPELVVVAKSSA